MKTKAGAGRHDRGKPGSLRRMVWRISPAVPHGEIVDASLPSTAPVARPPMEPSHPGWAMSSFELLHGVEISEEDPSTVPAELFDELFKKAPG